MHLLDISKYRAVKPCLDATAPHRMIAPTNKPNGGRDSLSIGQRLRAAVAFALALLAASPAASQDYPNKPVRIVVGFAAGSVSDLVARALALKLGPALGQPFIVEVRPGAGSNVAAQHVVRSPKDGYTLFIATSSSTIRSTGTNPGFDFGTDLAPIAPIASAPFVLAAYPGLGAKTRAGVHCARQSQAGYAHFRRNAAGTTGYLVAQLFNQQRRNQSRHRALSEHRASHHRSDDRSHLDRIRDSGQCSSAHGGRQAHSTRRRPGQARRTASAGAVDRRGGIAGRPCAHLDRASRAG